MPLVARPSVSPSISKVARALAWHRGRPGAGPPPAAFHGTRARRRSLLTLAIETSCDDTAVALVESHDDNDGQVSSRSGSRNGCRARLHFNERITADTSDYKGVHPVVALESHQESLANLVSQSLEYLPRVEDKANNHARQAAFILRSSTPKRKPDFISVTRGPGMRSNLAVGLDTAKGLALGLQVPLVGVHHMQAHALTPRLVSALQLGSLSRSLDPEFPFLTLLISGGHTLLLESTGLTEHIVLAETTDVAVGDAIDKIARFVLPSDILELGKSVMYGAALERFAFPGAQGDASSDLYNYKPPMSRGEEQAIKPTPYGWRLTPPLSATGGGRKARSLQFSFTGLVSSVERFMKYKWSDESRRITKIPRDTEASVEERRTMAVEAMRVAFEHIAGRVVLALQSIVDHQHEASNISINALVVSGGVASNAYLRHILRAFFDAKGFDHIRLLFPPPYLCTDNAAMIGWAGLEMYRAGYQSCLDIRPVRKWSLDSSDEDSGILGIGGWIESRNPITRS